MQFQLIQTETEKPVFQRQLDADQWRWSKELQQQTDAAFEADEMQAFRMTGLYGQIPGAEMPSVRMQPKS